MCSSVQCIAGTLLACLSAMAAEGTGRITLSLDGTWEIEESTAPTDMPAKYGHTAPVPGLAHSARPAFPDVDAFDSLFALRRKADAGLLPKTAIDSRGIARQTRNYFWYRKTFRVPEKRQTAVLTINKAQFGTEVWLNGKRIGEHLGCFTASVFDITPAIDWKGENALVVRVGAHPGVLPPSVPPGTDYEKTKWTPGIYDSVSLAIADNPVIETVQVAPQIADSSILVETTLRNYGPATATDLNHTAKPWKTDMPVAAAEPLHVTLAPGERKTVTQTVSIPNAHLWSPEDPFLYVLDSTTGGDSVSTRFGMREFRFDTATRRAYLNGKPYFLRGSNITLHRFFEDPKSGQLPWNEQWVRTLLVDIPKKMHWNSFRFCIGPVPQRWMDIADEAGLLIQNEYFIWTGHTDWPQSWSADELIAEYKEFMRDHWNHPSQALWDAANETIAPVLGDRIIPEVRGLDLSNRPWENGYNLPSGPDDPVEDHPYLFGNPAFDPVSLETMTGAKSTNSGHPTGHAVLINEYGWLWVNRDGTPTKLTAEIYRRLAGADATPERRFALDAYYLAGLTEFWRAHRNAAGVLHFVYVTASFPGAYTSDHFLDVEKLELEPHFADWVGEAFKPLGVYLNFWHGKLAAGSERSYAVMMVNDDARPAAGVLRLAFIDAGGTEVAGAAERRFAIPALGQQTYLLTLSAPAEAAQYTLRAVARPDREGEETQSRRFVEITAAK